MKRRLFNLLAALSLLMCVATVALWVHCSSRCECFVWEGSRWEISLLASRHEMALAIELFDRPMGYRGPKHRSLRPVFVIDLQQRCPHFIGGAGFGFGYGAAIPVQHQFGLFLPPSLVVVAASGLAVYFRHRAKRSIRLPGMCPSCGYDLRATPDRCPECGTVAAKLAAKS
jgi:hypothetical protein